MIERDDGARFLLKALQTVRIPGKAHGQEFERGLAACCHVGGQIDFAHPATAYRFRNFVVADRLTDQRISLPILNNLCRETNGRSFNEALCSLT